MRFELGAPINTERLVLRPVGSEDVAAMHAYECLEEVARYLYWDPRTEEETRASVERKIRSTSIANEGDVLSLAAVRRDTGELIGDVVLSLTSAAHRQGEIGFVFHPAPPGTRLRDRSDAAAPRDRARGARPAPSDRPERGADVASVRVLEKLGMRREAHLIENEFVKGEWQSELVYAILADEWRAADVR